MARETILIVDDDEDIREIITLYLENENYNVISAINGNQAIASAFLMKPDLIILDIMLPDLDGIEVCQEIRKKLSTSIIFLSSKSTSNDKYTGLIAGGDDYVCKPFDSMELLARVKAHLRRNRILEISNIKNTSVNQISYPNLSIDLNNYVVVVKGIGYKFCTQ
jgi:DNA-binding response OmpR family regulator